MLTKIFRSGNSLAVRIPAKLAVGKAGDEVEINIDDGNLIVTPPQQRLKGLMGRFAAFDREFMKQGRERGREPDRSW